MTADEELTRLEAEARLASAGGDRERAGQLYELALDLRERRDPSIAELARRAAVASWAHVTAGARKGGRRSPWPYVPILKHAPTPGSPAGHTEQLRGLAYATRPEAVEAAQRHRDAAVEDLYRKLLRPEHRALREHHGLPAELPA